MKNQQELIIRQTLAVANFPAFFKLLKTVSVPYEKNQYLELAILTAKTLKNLGALRDCVLEYDVNDLRYSTASDILEFLVQLSTNNNHALDVAFRIASQKKLWFDLAKVLFTRNLETECIDAFSYLTENYEKEEIALKWLGRYTPHDNPKAYFDWLTRQVATDGKYSYPDPSERLAASFQQYPHRRGAILEQLDEFPNKAIKHRLLIEFVLICIQIDDVTTLQRLQPLLPDELSWLMQISTTLTTGENWACLSRINGTERKPLLEKFCKRHLNDLFRMLSENQEIDFFREICHIAYNTCLQNQALDQALRIVGLVANTERKHYLQALPVSSLTPSQWKSVICLLTDDDLVNKVPRSLIAAAPQPLLNEALNTAKISFAISTLDFFKNSNNIAHNHEHYQFIINKIHSLIDLEDVPTAKTCILKLTKSKARDALILRIITLLIKQLNNVNSSTEINELTNGMSDKITAKLIKQIQLLYQTRSWHKCLNLIAKCEVDLGYLAAEIMNHILLSANNLNSAINTLVTSNILNTQSPESFIPVIVDKVFASNDTDKQRLKCFSLLIRVDNTELTTRLLERILSQQKYNLVAKLFSQIIPDDTEEIATYHAPDYPTNEFHHDRYTYKSIQNACIELLEFTISKIDDPNPLLHSMEQARRNNLVRHCRHVWLRVHGEKLSATLLPITQNWPDSEELVIYLDKHIQNALIVNDKNWGSVVLLQMQSEQKETWSKRAQIWFANAPLHHRVDEIVKLSAHDGTDANTYTSNILLNWIDSFGFADNAELRYWQHFLYFLNLYHQSSNTNDFSDFHSKYKCIHYFELWVQTIEKNQPPKAVTDLLGNFSLSNPDNASKYQLLYFSWKTAVLNNCWMLVIAGQIDSVLANITMLMQATTIRNSKQNKFDQEDITPAITSLIDRCFSHQHYTVALKCLEHPQLIINKSQKSQYYFKAAQYYFQQKNWQKAQSILLLISASELNSYSNQILAICQTLIRAGELDLALSYRDQFFSNANEHYQIELIQTYIEAGYLTSAKNWCTKKVTQPHVIINLQNQIYKKYQDKLVASLGAEGERRAQTILSIQEKILRLQQLNPADVNQRLQYNQLKDECLQSCRTFFEKGIAAFAELHFGTHRALPVKGGNIYFALMEDQRFQTLFPDCYRYCESIEKTSTNPFLKNWLRIHLGLSNSDKHDPAYLLPTPRIFGQDIDMKTFLPEVLNSLTKMLIKLFNPNMTDQQIHNLTPQQFQFNNQLILSNTATL